MFILVIADPAAYGIACTLNAPQINDNVGEFCRLLNVNSKLHIF